jgi:hypothetical protein
MTVRQTAGGTRQPAAPESRSRRAVRSRSLFIGLLQISAVPNGNLEADHMRKGTDVDTELS